MRDQSGSGWKSGIVTFLVALISFGLAWWFTRRETGAVPVEGRAGAGGSQVGRDDLNPTSGVAPSRTRPGDSDPGDAVAALHDGDSAPPLQDGSPPPGFPIKGNPNSGLYHAPESPYYGRTKAQVYFRTAEAAEAAGFQHWNARRHKR